MSDEARQAAERAAEKVAPMFKALYTQRDVDLAAVEIEAEVAPLLEAQVKHAAWLNSIIDSVALAAHGWTEDTRQAYVPSMLSQQVAAKDAERDRLAKQVERLRKGIKLCIGLTNGIPWHEVSDADVDGYVNSPVLQEQPHA